MKYAVLAAALGLAAPVMVLGGLWFSRVRAFLFSLMICATVLGPHGSINAVSRALYRGPDRGFEFTLTDLVCWSLIVVLIARFPGRIEWWPRHSWLLLLFFLYACALATVSAEPLYTAFSLWKCLRIYCLYWCTVSCLRIGISRHYLWLGCAGSAFAISFLAVVQKYWLHIYRINGPFDHSNTVPLYANLLLPILLVFALCDREAPLTQAVISIVLCLGLLFAVQSTFSRAGMALAVACIAGALLWTNLRHPWKRARIASVVLCLLFAAAALRAAPSILERFRNAPKASMQARDEFNYAARLMLLDHPLGVGLNNFSYILTHDEAYREHFEAMKYEEQAGVAHHIYWLTAAETGFLGLALYLLWIARLAFDTLRGAWRQRNVYGALLFAIFLGLCALQAGGFLEWAFRQTPVMQLFAITAAASAAWIEKRRRRPRTNWSRAAVPLDLPAPAAKVGA
jgi:O-antigen ligase